MTEAAATRETLQKARDLLMELEWVKRASHLIVTDEKGFQTVTGHCAIGAVNAVTPNVFSEEGVIPAEAFQAMTCLGRCLPAPTEARHAQAHHADPVVFFNDHPATTFNDVMALFDEAIRRAKEETE